MVYARDHWQELHGAQSGAMDGPPPTAERDLTAARGGLLDFFQVMLFTLKMNIFTHTEDELLFRLKHTLTLRHRPHTARDHPP